MLGHLIYTFDRVHDARINQELSRSMYASAFGGVHIVHAYNGEERFHYTKYLEDDLILLNNRGHYRGAVDLINAGLMRFAEVKDIRYVLVTAADTWVTNVKWLQSVLDEMAGTGRALAASSWRTAAPTQIHGLSLDCFILDQHWNSTARVFPLDYDIFYERYADLLGALLFVPPIPEVALQHAYHRHFLTAYRDNEVLIERNRRLRRIVEREPGCVRENASGRASTGVWHSHKVDEKREALISGHLECGVETRRLMSASDLSYFNAEYESTPELVQRAT